MTDPSLLTAPIKAVMSCFDYKFVEHFRSLTPVGQDAPKPIFDLTVGDGAHSQARGGRYRCLNDSKEITQ